MRTSSIVTLVLFVLFLLFMVMWLIAQRGSDAIEAPMKLAQLRQAVGLFIATVSALALLLGGLAQEAAGRAVPLVISLFAGVLLIEPNWSVALGLAAITLAIALRAWLPVPRRELPAASPQHEPPVL
jgi:hypothetical protein